MSLTETPVIVYCSSHEMTTDERLAFKRRVADAFRATTGFEGGVGVDLVPLRAPHSASLPAEVRKYIRDVPTIATVIHKGTPERETQSML